VAVLDIGKPDVDGYELFKRIRQRPDDSLTAGFRCIVPRRCSRPS
jgi:CheY-like chemotaxis protein